MLLPEQSAAKAKQVLQQATAALGGDAYLNVQDVTCTGRMTSFDHSGDLSDASKILSLAPSLPIRLRQENTPKRNIINVFERRHRDGNSIAAASPKRRPPTWPSSGRAFRTTSTIFCGTESTSRT